MEKLNVAIALILSAMIMAGPITVFRVNAEVPPWPGYVKIAYPDYAPSGMPDFDEKQDAWGPLPGVYTWCCPVAVANSLWWLDSEFESVMFAFPVPPPTISDHFNLVASYNPGVWDDHDLNNVPLFVTNLAFLMDTDGQRTHDGHKGTRWTDVPIGIQQYLIQQGMAGLFEVHGKDFPDFAWIDNETEKCQDVELFLEFWRLAGGVWTNTTMPISSLEFGHCVTSAGSDPATSQLLISDPYFDVSTPIPPPVHNDAQFVSHDAYPVSLYMGPGPGPYGPLQPVYELTGYWLTMGLDPSYHAFIRGAVATSPLTSPVHDVAVTNLTSAKTVLGQGFLGNLTATVKNQGDFTETFNVTAYANATIYITSQMVTLTKGTSADITLVWNATGFAKSNYTINAYAWPVPGPETNTANNNFTDGWVIVAIACDITGITGWPDGRVDMKDIAIVARCFGSKPGDSNWKPNADFNNDGKIDMKDIALIARHFGNIDP